MLRLARHARFYSNLKTIPLRPPSVRTSSAKQIQRPTNQNHQEQGQQGQQQKNFEDKSKDRQSTALQVIRYAVGVLIALHLNWSYGYPIISPYGVSMLPTLHVTGEVVLLSRHYSRGRDVQVGDIITFKHPILDDIIGMKRVIGMPGDYVLSQTPAVSDQMIQIPQGHCFVVGDNSLFSRDSRHFGPIPMALITGKAIARLSPFSRMCWFDDPFVPA